MKILMISSLFPPNIVGGAEQSANTLAKALVARGHDIHVATLEGPNRRERKDPIDQAINVHEIPLANVYWPFNGATRNRGVAEKIVWHTIDTANDTMARRLQATVKKVKPDIVLSRTLQGFSTAVLPALKSLGVPIVQGLHDYAFVCPQTALFRNGKGCGIGSERCMRCRVLTAPRHRHLQSLDAVVGVSRSVLDLHLQHGLFNGYPSRVIYNALKPSIRLRTEPPQRPDGHVFTFGFMGRVDRMKGIETLLAAAAQVEGRGYRFKVLVAGKADPDYLSTLKERWPSNNIEYVGYVDSGRFLQRLDTLVFPTEWLEALGNGVFEAFSQGVPVIGSDAGGIPESINQGVNGYVFPKGNVEKLADRMIRLVAEPALQSVMAEAAIAKATEYLPSNRARQYEEFFIEVLERSKRSAAA